MDYHGSAARPVAGLSHGPARRRSSYARGSAACRALMSATCFLLLLEQVSWAASCHTHLSLERVLTLTRHHLCALAGAGGGWRPGVQQQVRPPVQPPRHVQRRARQVSGRQFYRQLCPARAPAAGRTLLLTRWRPRTPPRRRCDCPRHRAGEQCERELDSEEACKKHFVPAGECLAHNPRLCLNGCNARGACIGGFCHCQPGDATGWSESQAANASLLLRRAELAQAQGTEHNSISPPPRFPNLPLTRRPLGRRLLAVLRQQRQRGAAGGHGLQARGAPPAGVRVRAAAALQRVVSPPAPRRIASQLQLWKGVL
jgi:hypothetical protein